MADEGAGGVVDIIDKSQSNDAPKEEAINNEKSNAENPPAFLHSVSRTSLTFYSSDNAKVTAKKKLESLRSNFNASYNAPETKDSEKGDEEADFLNFVLGYVSIETYHLSLTKVCVVNRLRALNLILMFCFLTKF